jgi:hypothetical protein
MSSALIIEWMGLVFGWVGGRYDGAHFGLTFVKTAYFGLWILYLNGSARVDETFVR